MWPSAALLAILLLLFVETYVIAARPTLRLRRFVLAFASGCVTSVVISMLLERVLARFVGIDRVSFTAAPVVEELAKALPLIAVLVWRDWRKLTIADLALIGVASGLGFEFVESNLRVLTHGTMGPAGVVSVSPLLAGWRAVGSANAAGHAVWTGVVGTAVGVGLHVWPRGRLALLPGVFALAWVTFDHSAFNWQVVPTPSGQPRLLMGAAQSLYAITLNGRLELLALPIGLLASARLEGLRARRLIPTGLMLPFESKLTTPREWSSVVRASLRSLDDATRIAAFFRLRRSLAVVLQQARGSNDALMERHAQFLTERLQDLRNRLELPRSRRAPRTRAIRTARLLPTYGFVFLFGAYSLLLFGVVHGAMPGWVYRPITSSPVWLALAVTGLAYGGWRLVQFRQQPRPEFAATTGDVAIGWELSSVLIIGSLLLPLVSVAGWLAPALVWAPLKGAFVSEAVGEWVACGGVPPPVAPSVPNKTWVGISLMDSTGTPVAGASYVLSRDPSGAQLLGRSGVLDSKGYAYEYDLDQGPWYVSFPDLDASSWEVADAVPRVEG